MLTFISTAFADSPQQLSTAKDNFASLIPIFLIFFIFYFMLIRPQAKKQREHNLMISQLKVGDKVIVSNSIVGHISRLKENEEMIHVEIAPNTYIEVIKNSITIMKNTTQTNDKNKIDNNTNKKN